MVLNIEIHLFNNKPIELYITFIFVCKKHFTKEICHLRMVQNITEQPQNELLFD
jgi:hypothetical protein